MKTQLMTCLATAHERREARAQRQWQRIRRFGRRRFIILFVAGFWLLMLAQNLLATWIIFPSFGVLYRLPHHFYYRLLIVMPFGSFALCFLAACCWKINERKYANDCNA